MLSTIARNLLRISGGAAGNRIRFSTRRFPFELQCRSVWFQLNTRFTGSENDHRQPNHFDYGCGNTASMRGPSVDQNTL